MNIDILTIPEKEFETLRVLMCEALDESNKCKCLSCKGLQVLAKRIVESNSTKYSESPRDKES